MGEGEGLVELLAPGAALAEVDEHLTEARSGESFAADRAGLPAECGGFEQMRARRMEISSQ